jgi:hypothetical protein
VVSLTTQADRSGIDAIRRIETIFVLERGQADTALDVVETRGAAAVVELVKHSYAPMTVGAAGLQPQRLRSLSRIAGRVPVRRLMYPGRFDQLPKVVEHIMGSRTPSQRLVS